VGTNLLKIKSLTDDINTYAQKSFDYVLNDIKYHLAPDQSAYGTNYYKAGVCYGKLNLYTALCRRKGIETRFKIIPFRLTQGFEEVFYLLYQMN
jgi:Transglutaminase-like superfamily.